MNQLVDFIRHVVRGNETAVDFFMMLHRVLHFWDDLIDKDKPISDLDTNVAMWTALIDLPNNTFYRDNFHSLQPVLANAIANWATATKFEREPTEKRLEIAFISRSDYINVLLQCAYIVGGAPWLFEITPVVREHWTTEDFSAYKAGLDAENSARDATNQNSVKV